MQFPRGGQALERLLEYTDVNTVLDIGSGAGEHAAHLRENGKQVTTISMIEPADYIGDFLSWRADEADFDAIWACHVLEHQTDPGAFLRYCRQLLRPDGYLVVTVPLLKNAIVGGHVVLWNAGLLLYQLILAGFDCREARVGTYGYNISVIVQNKPATLPELHHDNGDIARLAEWFPLPVTDGFDGRLANINWGGTPAPRHIVIIGLGPSAEAYVDHVKRLGSRQAFADQVWAINGMGSVLDCDVVFHMDDVRIQEIRAAAKPQSNIANMLTWLHITDTPVMTSFSHPDYPSLVEFPLEAVVNSLGRGYFNGTAAYAVALAIHIGVQKISLFGCDFTYPDAHKAEKGRACVEFWLGFAAARGIEIAVPTNTSLLDALDDQDESDIPSYGYDAVKISCERDDNGQMKLTFTPRETLPTAEEIEGAYDHGKHPMDQKRAKGTS